MDWKKVEGGWVNEDGEFMTDAQAEAHIAKAETLNEPNDEPNAQEHEE